MTKWEFLALTVLGLAFVVVTMALISLGAKP